MENCIFDGKRICAYETKNKYGVYEFDRVEALKIAGDSKNLICEECGATVYLKAGLIKIPHFAHHSNQGRNCYYENIQESEEHRVGKFFLYQHLKQLYPDAEVQTSYKFPNRRRADILVTFSDGRRMVVEYQRKDVRVLEWRERHEHYKSQGIPDIWFLSALEYGKRKELNVNKVKFFEELIMKHGLGDQLAFLNTEKKRITLVQLMQYWDVGWKIIKEKELYSKSYPIEDIIISPEGQLVCDFEDFYINALESFLQKHYEQEILYKKEQEEAKKKAELNIKLQYEWQNQNYQASPSPTQTNYIKMWNSMDEKPYEELKKEALEAKARNPIGPWYDSTQDDKWGTCLLCGAFTKKWFYFDNANNTCKCKKCDMQRK